MRTMWMLGFALLTLHCSTALATSIRPAIPGRLENPDIFKLKLDGLKNYKVPKTFNPHYLKDDFRIDIKRLKSKLSTSERPYTFDSLLVESLTGSTYDIPERCVTDQITNAAAARARIDYMYRCHHLDRSIWENEFVNKWDRASRTWVKLPDGQLKYPIMTKKTAPYEVVKLEDITNNLVDCALPSDVTLYAVCLSGCYERDQKLAFADGDHSLAEVYGDKSRKLLTLGQNEDGHGIVWKESEIGYYTSSPRESLEKLVRITTADSTLTVTPDHPVLGFDGHMVDASTLKRGDILMKDNGDPAPILKLETYEELTKVFNIAPKSTHFLENVLSAQGLLTGSHRYQDGILQPLSHILERRETTPELLEE